MKIRNTTDEAKRYPGSMLTESMLFGSSGAIERQEEQGQRELVQGWQLPTNLGPRAERDPAVYAAVQAKYEAMGFVFGPPTFGDPLFREATLPAGWAKRGTDHAMWSTIVDEKGRERVAIFYKAAFYDRKAHMHLTLRYRARTDEQGATWVPLILRDGETLHALASIAYDPQDDRAKWNAYYAAEKAAASWLEDNRPNWTDPAMYWDED